MPNPAFELSIDVRLLTERLLGVAVGARVTYADLSAIIGQPVHGATPALQAALRRALKSGNAVFENVRGVGYQRLADVEIVAASERDVRAIRRKAKRSAQRLTRVQDFANLPQDRKIEHNTRLSILSAVAQQTSRPAETRVMEAVKAKGAELPFAATLEAFKAKP